MSTNRDVRRMFENVAEMQHELRRRIDKVENAPADLRHAAIDGGKGLVQKDPVTGDVVFQIGTDPVTGVTAPEYRGGPAPEQPSVPFLDAGGETVKIQHSGLDVYENPAPANFRRAHVHVSQVETFEPGFSTFAGYMDAPDGSFTHRLPGGEWWIGIVWETLSGKHSPMSETVLADVAPLVDADEIDEAIAEAKTELEQAIDERGNRYGTEPPTEPAHDGVIYYQRDTANGPVVAVWQYRDNQWHGLPMTDAVLTSVTTDKLVAGESLIDGVLIKDGAVTLEKITVTEEMTAAVAKFLTVRTDMLESNAVTADKIGTDAIEARHIAAKAIEADMIDAGAIRTEHVDTKSFVLSDSDSYTRTSISAEGMEVIETWSGYTDPTLQDPDLLAARHWTLDGWNNYQLSDSRGNPLFPDTRRFTTRFRVTVHSMTGLEVRAHTRDTPEAGSAYWTGSWNQTITAPGKYYLALSAHDTYPYFAWLGLKGEVTLDEMWFEPRQSITDLPILSVTKDGLKSWDSSGSETASIGSGGQNFIAGRFFTNSPGQPGVLLNEDYGPGSRQGAGVWFTDDGSASASQAAIWAWKDTSTEKYHTLNIRGPAGGEVEHRTTSRFNGNQFGSGSTAVYIDGWLRNGGYWETSSAANVSMNSGWGTVGRVSSRRAIKVNIKQASNDPANILKLDPKSWVDLGQLREDFAEAGLDIDDYVTPDEGEGPKMDEAEVAEVLDGLPKRTVGLVAEEVVEAGLMEYADWTQDEETGQYHATGVNYDRAWLPLIPLVREHRDRITALEQQNADLEQRLARLEAKQP